MIHVLTLTWNGLDKLEKCKDGLFQNLKGHDYIWHIRDNGSKDGTVKEVSHWLNTKIYEIGHNRDSFAAGMNYLFDQANPSDDNLILLLNNDVSFGDDVSINKMINLQKKVNADVVGARLLYNNSNKLQHAGVTFSKTKYGQMPFHHRPGEESDKEAEKNRYFQVVTAAVMLVKASTWRKVGGMGCNYKWAFDDVDLNLRIGKAGGIITYCGETKIFHEESASLKKNPVNKLFLDHNVKQFKKDWFGKYEFDRESYLNDPDYKVIK